MHSGLTVLGSEPKPVKTPCEFLSESMGEWHTQYPVTSFLKKSF
jgi:hypothetical protein